MVDDVYVASPRLNDTTFMQLESRTKMKTVARKMDQRLGVCRWRRFCKPLCHGESGRLGGTVSPRGPSLTDMLGRQ